jgi:phosphatidate phosphatase APP1
MRGEDLLMPIGNVPVRLGRHHHNDRSSPIVSARLGYVTAEATPDTPVPDRSWARHAARMEDRFHRWRERRARRRGLSPVVIPYRGYGTDEWVRVLCRVLLTKPRRDSRSARARIRGWRSFVSVPVAHAVVTVTIGDVEVSVRADRGGVVDVDLPLATGFAPGEHTITLNVENGEPLDAPIRIIDPDARIGLLSDIDDTVMVTALPRPFLAAWNTFVLDERARRPVPGMAVLYERIVSAHPGIPVVYLSTGAWNVAPTLERFLGRHLYPTGTLLLTDWGPTTDRLFRSGREHKRASLERLATEFPDIRWILVGDDGQHDEELYQAFVDSHPDNVAAVAIRQLSTPEAVFAGGRRNADVPHRGAPWVQAPSGAEIAEALREIGMLPGR